MKIERFWIVVRPNMDSELADVCFETDAKGLARQFRGGLQEDDIHAAYTERAEAEIEAARVMTAFRRYLEALAGSEKTDGAH